MFLNIETSSSSCSVSLQDDGELLGSVTLHIEKSHSSALPLIIGDLFKQTQTRKTDLKAVGISAGPGSYTGLRIGASMAKGLAYAMKIPLIAVNSLDTLIRQLPDSLIADNDLVVPMLDARRMEVYTKAVDKEYNELMPLQAKIIDQDSFRQFRDRRLVLFGDGAAKAFQVLDFPEKVLLKGFAPSAVGMVSIVQEKYIAADFVNTAYFEPIYLKEFQTKKSKDLLRP